MTKKYKYRLIIDKRHVYNKLYTYEGIDIIILYTLSKPKMNINNCNVCVKKKTQNSIDEELTKIISKLKQEDPDNTLTDYRLVLLIRLYEKMYNRILLCNIMCVFAVITENYYKTHVLAIFYFIIIIITMGFFFFLKNNTWLPDDNGINTRAESSTNHELAMSNRKTEKDFCAYE